MIIKSGHFYHFIFYDSIKNIYLCDVTVTVLPPRVLLPLHMRFQQTKCIPNDNVYILSIIGIEGGGSYTECPLLKW